MGNGLTSMALGDAYVDIMGNTGQLASSLAQAQGMVGGFIGGMGKAIVAGIGGAFLMAGGLVGASLKSFMEEEAGLNRMAAMFDAAGLKTAELVPQIEALGQAMLRTTTLTDNQVRATATQAASLGVAGKNIEAYTKLAIGLGARRGMDPEGAMRLIVRASQGHMAMFARLGIQIDTTKSKQEQFNQVAKFSMAGFDVETKKLNTLSGAFKQMRNAFGETLDALGTGLFEKSGLNKEIKTVTASIFGIVKSLEKGFATGAFKGFSFAGLGGFIGNLLLKFTAMLMTIPDAFKVLKELFADPSKLLFILFEGMISVGKVLLKVLAEGFSALSTVFVGLGKALYYAFADLLSKGEMFGKMFKPAADKAKEERLGKLGDEELGKLYVERMMARFSGSPWEKQQGFQAMSSSQLIPKAGGGEEWLLPVREMMIEALKTEDLDALTATFFKSENAKAMDEVMMAIPDSIKRAGEFIKEEVKRLNGMIAATTDVNLIGVYKQRLAELQGLADKEKIAGVGLGDVQPDYGGGAKDKISFSIVSMSEQWKKLQGASAKGAAEKEAKEIANKQLKALDQIEKNTSDTGWDDQTNSLFVVTN